MPAVAGLATGIIVIGCLVGRFFTGSIVHQAGYRRVLFCGVLLYLAASLAYFAADSLALIFLVRFVSGVAVGIVGTVTGTIVMTVFGTAFNAVYLIPKFAQMYGMPLDAIIAMGTAIHPSIHDVTGLVILCVAPLNLIKGGLVSLITVLIYKRLSPILKTASRRNP